MREIKRLHNHPYGYRVDITGEYERRLYDRFKAWKSIPPHIPLSDTERKEFEDYVLRSDKDD